MFEKEVCSYTLVIYIPVPGNRGWGTNLFHFFFFFLSSEVNTDSGRDGEMRKRGMTDIKNERQCHFFFLCPDCAFSPQLSKG